MTRKFGLVIILFCSLLFSFEWPVSKKIITATFGERRWDHFHSGIDIGGGEQDVYPAEDGEVVFYFEEDSSSNIPSGMGNFVVLEHERGLRTLYAHLKAKTINTEKVNLVKNDILGVSGNSGGSLGTHLHFEIIDSELKEIVNPLLILPPLKDKVRPKIVNVIIKDGDNMHSVNSNRLNIKPGLKSIYLEAYDLSPWVSYHCPVALHEISVFFNGEQLFNYKYEKLLLDKNRIILNKNNNKSSSEYYLDNWLFLLGEINFTEKQNTMKLIVKDINGNESSKIIYISIGE